MKALEVRLRFAAGKAIVVGTLSPLYDFTRSEGPNGWHTLSVSGEDENPTDKDLLRLASDVDLASSDARDVLDAMRSAVTAIPAKMKQMRIRK
ncbi:MAG: hypothetical protein PHW08_01075 [Kiritimatiellae bacterium]|nr:hypothetical protein [Kiritimatiellia bacterium]